MKNIGKRIWVIVLAGIMMLGHANIALATGGPTEAVYNLQEGGRQEFTIQDADGEKATVIVEEIPGNTRVDAGTYKITHKAASWTAGFYVQISNNKFISAYSPFYDVRVGTISGTKLTKDSDIKVTYSFKHKLLLTRETGVVAKISNSELVISKK